MDTNINDLKQLHAHLLDIKNELEKVSDITSIDNMLVDAILPYVPVKTGKLKNSAIYGTGKNEAFVEFTAPYAANVNDRVGYLEKGYSSVENKIVDEIESSVVTKLEE